MGEEHLKLPLLNSYIEHWAKEDPGRLAMIQHEDGRSISYKKFSTLIDFFALRLLDLGIGDGDRVATMLVLVPEHMALMYACFKIGAIVAPLDVRLMEDEVVRDLNKIEPKAFFFLGKTPVKDFREVGRVVRERCASVKHLVQFTPNPGPGELLEGATSITDLMNKARLIKLKIADLCSGKLKKKYTLVGPKTPALIIYTTGTTGAPKPAVLCHENILVQNEILRRSAELSGEARLLVNLPPSHVGCVTEGFMTTIYAGGTVVMLRIFDVKATLEAIEKWKVDVLGMIPTQYRMMWAHPDYEKFDLSSLKYAVYAGSAVDLEFIRKLSAMAPKFGTGIGMTESAGFVTFTPQGLKPEEVVGQVGAFYPDLANVSIREPMKEDGMAGAEFADGEIGEICYHPPIVFQGYYNMPEETATTISKDRILYTGDLGFMKEVAGRRCLFLSGRRKMMIKQKGYNVFPDEVENHIAELAGVDTAEVVGAPHRMIDEGIIAFVRPQEGADLTAETVKEHCRKIASYKRPQHVEIWPAGKEFPLTRVAKVDKLKLKDEAAAIIEKLRAEGKWDAGA